VAAMLLFAAASDFLAPDTPINALYIFCHIKFDATTNVFSFYVPAICTGEKQNK
jgi:hypothetical protein